ncbi:tRNA (guanine-N(7)-)-methyltransferase [Dirofilaria immitis]
MHLVVEKYRNVHNIAQPPEPILVPFKRYSRDCVVSAIMEFINYNFIMDSPPKYRDSDGDMILLETREAFEAAVDDVMQTSAKLFIVHVDGIYKFELPKEQDAELSMAAQACSSCDTYMMNDFDILMDRIMKRVKQEVSNQIVLHPVISKLAGFMNEFEEQKTYGMCYSEQKSARTLQADISDAAASSSSSSLENQSPSKIVSEEEEDTTAFQLIDESPVWDVKAIYERKTVPSMKWENPSSSDLLETAREGEGIFSKRWVLRRFACRRWQNVSIINETLPDMLEIHRSKMTVTNLPEKGQIVDFTVWVKCLASTGYFCATWRLHKMIDSGRDSIPEGPSLTFEIFVNPFSDENFTLERPLFSNELDWFSYYARIRNEEQNVDDTQELEELVSSGSVSASDYEVINGGETMDVSEEK